MYGSHTVGWVEDAGPLGRRIFLARKRERCSTATSVLLALLGHRPKLAPSFVRAGSAPGNTVPGVPGFPTEWQYGRGKNAPCLPHPGHLDRALRLLCGGHGPADHAHCHPPKIIPPLQKRPHAVEAVRDPPLPISRETAVNRHASIMAREREADWREQP